MITLGGNIQLEGFDELEYGEALIAKKLVGNYIRVIAENCKECTLAAISLDQKEEEYAISVHLEADEQKIETQSQGDNLFFTMDKALKNMLAELNLKV